MDRQLQNEPLGLGALIRKQCADVKLLLIDLEGRCGPTGRKQPLWGGQRERLSEED